MSTGQSWRMLLKRNACESRGHESFMKFMGR